MVMRFPKSEKKNLMLIFLFQMRKYYFNPTTDPFSHHLSGDQKV